MTTPERPLRADAARNREAILAAAEALYAAEGVDVAYERIASDAGVGVGTLYRRFPSRDHLLRELLEEKMARYAERVEQGAERALEDPRGAFRDYLRFMVEWQAKDLSFSDALLDRCGAGTFSEQTRRAHAASLLLVERARAAGVLVADFAPADLRLAMYANSGVLRLSGPDAAAQSARLLEYLLRAFTCDPH